LAGDLHPRLTARGFALLSTEPHPTDLLGLILLIDLSIAVIVQAVADLLTGMNLSLTRAQRPPLTASQTTSTRSLIFRPFRTGVAGDAEVLRLLIDLSITVIIDPVAALLSSLADAALGRGATATPSLPIALPKSPPTAPQSFTKLANLILLIAGTITVIV